MEVSNKIKIQIIQTEIVNKVSELIRQKRLKKGYSYKLLGEISGVDRTHIARIEQGLRPNYAFTMLARLFSALKIEYSEIDDLLEQD